MNTTGLAPIDEWFERLLPPTESSLRILTDDSAVIETLVGVSRTAEAEQGTTELLCSQESLKQLERDFVTESHASHLAAESRISFRSRTDTEPELPTLVFDGSGVTALLPVGGHEIAPLAVEAADTRQRLKRLYHSMWESGLPFTPDLPPYPAMLSLADQHLGTAVRDDFETATEVLQQRTDGESLKPVALVIVLGARHQTFVADIADWTETTGLATQATVSKVKTELEELGVVATESVPHGVGHPRQQLRFAEDSFNTLAIEELVATVQSAF